MKSTCYHVHMPNRDMSNYYVYVYIDPRNFEEFYFGKGRGSRKNSHLSDSSDTEKVRRIDVIRKAGLKPIIRVIASNLTEHDALLVEKTLLWKLGRQLTNVSSGHYADNFRPHDTLHLDLTGFDFQNGIYYYNVGEGHHRNWDDYKQFGFTAAGQGVRWRDAMLAFQRGDVVAAYLSDHGFVGIGLIKEPARKIQDVVINGKPLLKHRLRCKKMGDNLASDELCEYVCTVDWKRAVERKDAKWKPQAGLYAGQLVRASLDGQPATIEFLEREFSVVLRDLVA